MHERRLASIDWLRGVAILAVLAIHIPHDAPGGWREHPFFFFAWLAEFGYLGVPLFILISGFCIHRRAADSKRRSGSYAFSWPQFWLRRFIRLYPPYVAAIVLSVAAAFFLHQRVADPSGLLGWDLVTHLLMVHNLTWEYATGLGNGAFWSLGTEEQLYALYYLLLLLWTRQSPRIALMVAASVTVVWRLFIPHLGDAGIDVGPFSLGKWYQWPMQYWLHWVLGAVAVDAWFGNRKLPDWCQSLPMAAGLIAVGMSFNNATFALLAQTSFAPSVSFSGSSVLWQTLHYMGELVLLVGLFCLLNGLLKRELSGARPPVGGDWLGRLGRISYSVYLVHIPVIYALQAQVSIGASPAEWLPRFVLFAAAAVLCGYLFHMGVERWFLDGRWPWQRAEAPIKVVASG